MEIRSFQSNQSSYPIGSKNTNIRSPIYRCYMWNMERISFTASEENADDVRRMDGQTTDACLYFKLTYEPSAQVS